MSGTEASEDNESSGGLKKQNFTGEADLTDVVMHDSDDLGTRRLWAECVATLTSPYDLRTDEGDIVIGRPIPCHIRAKIGDISDVSYASGQLAFNRAVRSSDGEEVAPNSFGMMLNLSKPEFRRFWDYQFGHWSLHPYRKPHRNQKHVWPNELQKALQGLSATPETATHKPCTYS